MVAEVGEVVGDGGQVPVVTEVGSGRLAEGVWGPSGLLGGVSFVPPGVWSTWSSPLSSSGAAASAVSW